MLPDNAHYRNTLLDRLNAHFALDEVDSLCFRIGIDKDNLPGTTKQNRLISLLERLDERGIDGLLGEARKLRPDLGFPLPPWQHGERVSSARRMERNHAYREAADKWREILAGDPDDPRAAGEIERLEEKIEQAERLHRFKKDILKRKNDIAPVFMAVATRLRQLEKQELDAEAEVLLDVIGDFLDNNTSGAEFIELWQQGIAAPPQVNVEAPNFQALAGRLQRGEIVVFLGMATSAEHMIPALADYADYAEFHGSMPEICEYFNINLQYGRGTLCHKLEELVRGEALSPTPLHQTLARVGVPTLIVTTALDGLLEEAFDKAGRPYVQVSHVRDNEETGGLLLKYHDRDEAERGLIEELSSLRLMENGYSVIYKLRGCLKLTRAIAPQSDALLLSERDYFRFARYLDKLVPSYVTRQLSGRGLWLLGHYPRSWEDRLLAEAILSKRGNEEQALTVHAEPDHFARAYWEYHRVKNYPLPLEDFVAALGKEL